MNNGFAIYLYTCFSIDAKNHLKQGFCPTFDLLNRFESKYFEWIWTKPLLYPGNVILDLTLLYAFYCRKDPFYKFSCSHVCTPIYLSGLSSILAPGSYLWTCILWTGSYFWGTVELSYWPFFPTSTRSDDIVNLWQTGLFVHVKNHIKLFTGLTVQTVLLKIGWLSAASHSVTPLFPPLDFLTNFASGIV